jgi:hypothetical protein
MGRKNRYMGPSNQPPRKLPQTQEIPPEVFLGFIQNQAAQLQVQQEEIKLQHRQLDANAAHANKTLEYQNDYLKRKPAQERLTFALISGVAFVFIGVLLWFCTYLIDHGLKDLVIKIVTGVGWIISNVVTFLLGRKVGSDKKQENSDQSSAEVV